MHDIIDANPAWNRIANDLASWFTCGVSTTPYLENNDVAIASVTGERRNVPS